MGMLFTVPRYDMIWCDTVTARYLLTGFVGSQPEPVALFMVNVQRSAMPLFMCVAVCQRMGLFVFIRPRLCQRRRGAVCLSK